MGKYNYTKLNVFFSTLNFILLFVGYQLATSLLLPISSSIEGISRSVTVPYRGFALLISLVVIFLNIKRKIGKTPVALKVLWIFWIALIIRIFYDTNIRTDVHLNDTRQLWLYVFGICLPAMFSVMKSIKMIDLEKALKWVYFGTVLTLFLSLFTNTSLLLDSAEVTGRAEANLAFDSIAFGHLGTTGVILSMFLLSKAGVSLIRKFIYLAVILLSFFVIVRAGSRSPVMALTVIVLFWLFARGRNILFGTVFIAIATTLLVVFIKPILNFMGNISPVMESRLRLGIYEQDSSGRDLLYERAINLFTKSPILGEQFALFDNYGGFTYSHNIILDAFMGLGILGGLSMIYFLWNSLKKSYLAIKYNDPIFWVSLLLIQQIVLNLFSSAFYYNQLLNALLVFIFLYSVKRPTKKLY
ncbi:O-antigen ligase family protein [Bacteroidales bacterium MB20-C3-3]|nr:O-antigen ligase family protein [Bacteroidales bacterium MB20-C3-3]